MVWIRKEIQNGSIYTSSLWYRGGNWNLIYSFVLVLTLGDGTDILILPTSTPLDEFEERGVTVALIVISILKTYSNFPSSLCNVYFPAIRAENFVFPRFGHLIDWICDRSQRDFELVASASNVQTMSPQFSFQQKRYSVEFQNYSPCELLIRSQLSERLPLEYSLLRKSSVFSTSFFLMLAEISTCLLQNPICRKKLWFRISEGS